MDSEETPHPDAGGTPTKREVTLRDDLDERVWVEWYVGNGACFTSILSEEDGVELRVLSLDSNELSQMSLALRQAADTGLCDTKNLMVRDLGMERVWVEHSDGYATIVFEKLGEIDRMLVLDETEVDELLDAIERAEGELPRTEEDPHV